MISDPPESCKDQRNWSYRHTQKENAVTRWALKSREKQTSCENLSSGVPAFLFREQGTPQIFPEVVTFSKASDTKGIFPPLNGK